MPLVNEEFLNAGSVEVDARVTFDFNEMPMVIAYHTDDGCLQIYKKNSDKLYRFKTGYSRENDRPKLLWENGIPDDIDIRVAADVMVAKLFQKLFGE